MRSMGRGTARRVVEGSPAEAGASYPSTTLRVVPLPIFRWGGKLATSCVKGGSSCRQLRVLPKLHAGLLADTGAGPLRRRTVAVAALGMAIPVVAGLLLGRLEEGLTIGLGAVLLAGAPDPAPEASAERPSALKKALPALLAVVAATAIGGAPWSDGPMIALVCVAGLASGYSRPLAIAAIQFSIYLVLSAGFLDGAAGHRGGAALIFGLGALWNIALRILLHERGDSPPETPPQPKRVVTAAQRRAHYRRTLRSLPGWQFPIRLGIGLASASAIRHLWPAHHFYWIMLTVALLTQRPVERIPTKTLQRLAGTIGGVAVTWAILGSTPAAALAGFVCVLAAALPIARSRSYLLYSIVSTPLILLVMDLGAPIQTSLLTDRLVATLVGGALVVAINCLLEVLLNRAERRKAEAR
jgi:Fusaric acid resistance protein-like